MKTVLRPKWVSPANVSVGGPAFVDDRVIFGEVGGGGTNSACRALKLSTGREIWRYEPEGRIYHEIASGEGAVYFPALSTANVSAMYALDSDTKALRWRTPFDGTVHFANVIGGSVYSAVVTTPSNYHFRTRLVEMDCETGVVLRELALLDRQLKLGESQAFPKTFVASANRIIIVHYSGREIQSVDLSNWSVSAVYTTERIFEAAALQDDTLYVCEGKGDGPGGFPEPSDVSAVNCTTWKAAWKQATPFPARKIFASATSVVARAHSRDVPIEFRCFEPATGDLRWTFTTATADGNLHQGDFGVFSGRYFVTQVEDYSADEPLPRSVKTVGLDVKTGDLRFEIEFGRMKGWVAEAEGLVLASHATFISALDLSRRWSIKVGGAIRGTPIITQDRILIGNADGNAAAIHLLDGFVAWKTALPAPVESSPACLGEWMFIGHRQGVSALRVTSGMVLWTSATAGAVTGALRIVEDTLVFGARDRRIHCISLTDGGPLWTFETGGYVEGGAAVDDLGLYQGSDDGSLYALSLDGALRWRFDTLAEIKSTPGVKGDIVIFGNAAGLLTAVDRRDGTLVWQRNLTGSLKSSSPTLFGDHFWITDRAGNAHCITVADGVLLWSVTGLGRLSGGVALHQDELHLSSLDGAIVTLSAGSGAFLRRTHIAAAVFASPVLGDDTLVVVDESGGVQALIP